MSTPPFAALLLAGGRSQRMGQDKGFLEWQGEPLWRCQLDKLKALKPQRLLLSCREEQRADFDVARSEVEWFFDPPNFSSGPLGILQRALKEVDLPLLVLAVDMPRMTTAWLQAEILTNQSFQKGRCFSTAAGLEPLAALYIPAMLHIMDQSLTANELSLQKLLAKANQQRLMEIKVAEHEILFSNCNTPAEWEHEKSRSVRPA